MSKKRFILMGLIIATAALFIFNIVNNLNNFDTGISFGPGGSGCERIETYIVIRNDEALPFNMAGWSFGDSHGSYAFPQHWIRPGGNVKLWSGDGVDDQENLYAGRSVSVWESDRSSWAITAPSSAGIYTIWGNSTCDPDVP
jgi:hypothetical protein